MWMKTLPSRGSRSRRSFPATRTERDRASPRDYRDDENEPLSLAEESKCGPLIAMLREAAEREKVAKKPKR